MKRPRNRRCAAGNKRAMSEGQREPTKHTNDGLGRCRAQGQTRENRISVYQIISHDVVWPGYAGTMTLFADAETRVTGQWGVRSRVGSWRLEMQHSRACTGRQGTFSARNYIVLGNLKFYINYCCRQGCVENRGCRETVILYQTMHEGWAQQRACMYAKDAVHEACAGKGTVFDGMADADAHSLQKRNS